MGQNDESLGALSDISDRKTRLALLARLDSLHDTLGTLRREVDSIIQDLNGGDQGIGEDYSDDEPGDTGFRLITIEEWYNTSSTGTRQRAYFEPMHGARLGEVSEITRGGSGYTIRTTRGGLWIVGAKQLLLLTAHDVRGKNLRELGVVR